jgi:DNA-binding NarL/FixJ family response regulator
MSFANDETAKELAGKFVKMMELVPDVVLIDLHMEGARFIDKMDLAEELIPALLQFASNRRRRPS